MERESMPIMDILREQLESNAPTAEAEKATVTNPVNGQEYTPMPFFHFRNRELFK